MILSARDEKMAPLGHVADMSNAGYRMPPEHKRVLSGQGMDVVR